MTLRHLGAAAAISGDAAWPNVKLCYLAVRAMKAACQTALSTRAASSTFAVTSA